MTKKPMLAVNYRQKICLQLKHSSTNRYFFITVILRINWVEVTQLNHNIVKGFALEFHLRFFNNDPLRVRTAIATCC